MEPLEHTPLASIDVAGRCALASTCGTEDPACLVALAYDPVQEVRLRVAFNPALPDLIRQEIVERDGDDAIRAYGEKMAQTEESAWVLECLTWCPYPSVRALVARNEHTPDDVIENLAYDEDETVQAAACEVLGW